MLFRFLTPLTFGMILFIPQLSGQVASAPDADPVISNPLSQIPVELPDEISPLRFPTREPLTPGLRWKGFEAHPSLGVTAIHDDNIFRTPILEEEDVILNISPSVRITQLDPWSVTGRDQSLVLQYTPTIVRFQDHPALDNVDHEADLQWNLDLDDQTRTELSQSFSHLTGNTEESGERLNRDLYDTHWGGQRELDSNWNFNFNVSHSIEDYETSVDSTRTTLDMGLNVEIFPHARMGPAIAVGYETADFTPDQYFQKPLLRFSYDWLDRWTLSLEGGPEIRENANDDRVTVSGTVGGNLTYLTPIGGTVTASYSRQVQNSATFQGQNVVTHDARLGLRQPLFGKHALSLNLGYTTRDFESVIASTGVEHAEDEYSIGPAVDLTLTRCWSLQCFATYRKRDADFIGRGFENMNIGISSSMNF